MNKEYENKIIEKLLFLLLREALKQTNNHFKTMVVENKEIKFSLLDHKESFVLKINENFRIEVQPDFENLSKVLREIYGREDLRCKERAQCREPISCIKCGGIEKVL